MFAGTMSNERQDVLAESIRLYEGVILSFERGRDRMRSRRNGATDSVMVHLDESLALNERTLDAMNRVLATAKEQLQQERARAGFSAPEQASTSPAAVPSTPSRR